MGQGRYEHDQAIANRQAGQKDHSALQSQRGNNDEASRDGAQDGAQCIQAKGIAHGLSKLAHQACPGLAGERERDAHEDRGDEHDGKGRDQRSSELHVLEVFEDPDVQPDDELRRAGNQLSRDEARHPDQHQDQPELNALVDLAQRKRGVNPTSQPDPDQEGAEHDRKAVGRAPG